MRIQLLPSSFGNSQVIDQHQRLTTFVVDDVVAIDAGSLAFGCSDVHRKSVRDVVISHTHLDHIAGLPIFIDDLFATLEEPLIVHATQEMVASLETHIFNWDIYPKFSEIKNDFGNVLEYRMYEFGKAFDIKHLRVEAVAVNHNSPSAGFLISDERSTICITGDTGETSLLWQRLSAIENLKAVFMECAFPDEMQRLATDSHHLTPKTLLSELSKLDSNCMGSVKICVSNIKATYRDAVETQLKQLNIPNLLIVEIGKIYEF